MNTAITAMATAITAATKQVGKKEVIVTVYHRIQPDYEKRMELMKRHALYWVQEGVSIPLNLAPIPLQDESERAQVRIGVKSDR